MPEPRTADPPEVRHPTELICASIGSLGFAALAIATPASPLVMTVTGWIAITVAVASLIRIGISRPAADRHARTRSELSEAQAILARRSRMDAAVAAFEVDLAGAASESQVLRLLSRVSALIGGERDVALVQSDCRATVDCTPRIWADSSDPLTCAHLHDGADGELAVSAVCVPLGTRHATVALTSMGPVGDLPDDATIAALAAASRRAGDRLLALGRLGVTNGGPLDPVTGLPPKRAALSALGAHLAAEVPTAVALLDLDRYEDYVAQHGETAADRAVQSVSDAICCTVRPGDVVARDGDDRFIVVFPNASASAATSAMERVREAMILEASDEGIAGITASVGIASTERHMDRDALIEAADVALVVAKRQGGNRITRSDFSRSV